MSEFTHIWFWKKWLPERKGQKCRILVTGTMNSVLLEFEDGYKVVTIRYGVRRLSRGAGEQGSRGDF